MRRNFWLGIGVILCLLSTQIIQLSVHAYERDGGQEDEQQQAILQAKGRSIFSPYHIVEEDELVPLDGDGGENPRAWMLNKAVFSRLSGAGKRAALRHSRKRVASQELSKRSHSIHTAATPGDNIRVNDPRQDAIFHTQSESSVAVNGQNVAVSFNTSGSSDDNFSGLSYSFDGGTTFIQKNIPQPDGFANLGDGVVAYGPDGELYYATLNFDPLDRSIVGVLKSTDNGITFGDIIDASTTFGNTADFQDKEWITVDKSSTSQLRGAVYVTWTDFTSRGSSISFARSLNNGKFFDPPKVLSTGDRFVQGSMPFTAPNGDLYVVYSAISADFTTDLIRIVKSTDGGATFSAPTTVIAGQGIGTMTGGNQVRTNSFPTIGIDKNGAVHVVVSYIPSQSTSDPADVLYVRSLDGGKTFSTPLKLNDDNTKTAQFLPSIAIAPDGTIAAKWWDRRNDPVNNSLTDVYMAISRDGGQSFGKNFRITNNNWVFAPTQGTSSSYHGDYDTLTADAQNFYLSWSDERGEDADTYFAQIPISRDDNAPDFNISVAKPYDQVLAGQSASFNLNTNSINGATGSLTLTASPAISGLTYNFDNPSATVGSAAKLSIATTSAVTPGTYLVTVTATSASTASSIRKTNLRINVFDPKRTASLPSNATSSPTDTFSGASSVKVDAKGVVHLAYVEVGLLTQTDSLFYKQSADGGKTFSSPIKVSANTQPNNFALALDPNGNVYIAYSGFSSTNGGIFLSKSVDGGKTFSVPVGVTSGDEFFFADSPSLAIDSKNNVNISFNNFFSNNSDGFYVIRSSNAGATFGMPVRVSSDQDRLSTGLPQSSVAVNAKGSVYVVYSTLARVGNRTIANVNLAIAKNGQTFKPSVVVSDGTNIALAPDVAIDSKNGVYVSYTQFVIVQNNVNREIMLTKSANKGKKFDPAVNVSNNPGSSNNSHLVVKNTSVGVVWQDTTNAILNPDIFFARSADGGKTFTTGVNISNNIGFSGGTSGDLDKNNNFIINWFDDSPANSDSFIATIPNK